MPNPLCEVNSASLGGWRSTAGGVNVVAGETVSVRLADTSGVKFWAFDLFGSDELVISPTLTVDVSAKTASFTAPTVPATGWALILRSTVGVRALGQDANGTAQDSYVSTFGVYKVTPNNGWRVGATNETDEGNSVGWTSKYNAVIRADNAGSGGGGAGTITAVADLPTLRLTSPSNNQAFIVASPPGNWVYITGDGANIPDDGESTVKLTATPLGSNGRFYNTGSTSPATIAALRLQASGKQKRTRVLCYSSLGDGGGGEFIWDATNNNTTNPDNGGTIIVPTALAGASGAWKRQYTGDQINVQWFGAKNDLKTATVTASAGATSIALAGVTATDIGKRITIPGGGAVPSFASVTNVARPHFTTIAAGTTTGTAVLTAALVTAVTAVTAGWGTDDTAARQATANFVASLPNGGAVLQPPAPSYQLGYINVANNTRFEGSGYASFIYCSGGDAFFCSSANNVAFHRVRIGGFFARGITFNGCTNTRIERCFLSGGNYRDPAQAGSLYLLSYDIASADASVESTTFTGWGNGETVGTNVIDSYAIACGINGYPSLNNGRFVGNYFKNATGRQGCVFYGAVGLQFLGNTLDGNNGPNPSDYHSGYGLALYSPAQQVGTAPVELLSRNHVVANNWFRNWSGPGAYIQGIRFTVIAANYFENCCSNLVYGSSSLTPAALGVACEEGPLTVTSNVVNGVPNGDCFWFKGNGITASDNSGENASQAVVHLNAWCTRLTISGMTGRKCGRLLYSDVVGGLRGARIRGLCGEKFSATGVELLLAYDCEFTDCHVRDASSAAFYVAGGADLGFTNCTALYSFDGFDIRSSYTDLDGCVARANAHSGVQDRGIGNRIDCDARFNGAPATLTGTVDLTTIAYPMPVGGTFRLDSNRGNNVLRTFTSGDGSFYPEQIASWINQYQFGIFADVDSSNHLRLRSDDGGPSATLTLTTLGGGLPALFGLTQGATATGVAQTDTVAAAGGGYAFSGTGDHSREFVAGGFGTTPEDAVRARNPIAAGAGAQQFGPMVTSRGHGWKTNATAGSQDVDTGFYTEPIQGAANPSAAMHLWSRVNGGSVNDLLLLRSSVAASLGQAILSLKDGGKVANGAALLALHQDNNAKIGLEFYDDTANSIVAAFQMFASTTSIVGQVQTGGNIIWRGDTHFFSDSGGNVYWRVRATATGPGATRGLFAEQSAGVQHISQDDITTNNVTANDLFLDGQNATGTTSTGGAVRVRPGSGTTAAGYVSLEDRSGNARIKVNGTGMAFMGNAPIARPASYTLTYATNTRTLSAYTTNAQSSAYTGATDGEAKLADLNALRVAYENLRTSHDELKAFVRQLAADFGAGSAGAAGWGLLQ